MVTEKKDVFASACAIARAFPLYANKSNMSQTLRKVVVEFVIVGTGNDKIMSYLVNLKKFVFDFEKYYLVVLLIDCIYGLHNHLLMYGWFSLGVLWI